jgi:hypothetical protein
MPIKLLSAPVNYAICKMEERNYPGIVVQGDSFYSLLILLNSIHESMEKKAPTVLEDEIIELRDRIELFQDVIEAYEKACVDNGFSLPYVKA